MRAASVPTLVVREIDRCVPRAVFADFADWHSYASPIVAVLTDAAPYGDLVLDITGVSHMFGGETGDARKAHQPARSAGLYRRRGRLPTASAPPGRWRIFRPAGMAEADTAAALAPSAGCCVAARRRADRRPHADRASSGSASSMAATARRCTARFGASLLLRLDQALGEIEERVKPRLPLVEHFAERRFAEPIGLIDDVLMTAHDLAIRLSSDLERHGLGAQELSSVSLSRRPSDDDAVGQCGAGHARSRPYRPAVRPSGGTARRRIRCGVRHRHDPAGGEHHRQSSMPPRPAPSRPATAPKISTGSMTGWRAGSGRRR